MNVAFVLLAKPNVPRGEDVARAFAGFAAEGQTLRAQPSQGGDPGKEVLELDAGRFGTGFVAAMPVPVPNREADNAARFSISAMGTGWTLPPHSAHLIVTLAGGDSTPGIPSLSCFTSFLAAVTKASGAVGVYWGNAGATHDPRFFLSIAKERGTDSRVMLWTGVSVAREADGRLSLLSLGMRQLHLPDLLLLTPKSMPGSEALGTFFDFLTYVAHRGEAPPEGDTVGRTEAERLPVRYVPSPIDGTKRVWRVELRG